MTNQKAQKTILTLAAIGLIPIALGYGLVPEKTLTPLYDFSTESINLKHIMRAIMGLYFGQIVIWFIGASKEEFRRPAMYCLVVFMLGLAAGRVLSLVIDGIPHWLLVVYLVLELGFGLMGLRLIRKSD
ncbi:DUF4345 domain-containing protein [Flagellimonas hymeniacidonis]|uniref:DUF4345 domain-containing protein n=1 Tax=Flagellimonas hymeniacidonis TaxID=2603628 RepID=A0A5C8V048_9FLAO|nr:DUF4345 domain-containing protein [Flagellimonas hymeniacidonis]TXN34980.1 DUF4345 domain-containing protein [Flagellimonas hymeniacidonis]